MLISPAFSNSEPLSMRIEPAPVHVVSVPERFFSVRPRRRSLQQHAPFRLSVAPLLTVVVPASLIAPSDHVRLPPTVMSPAPPIVPLVRLTVVGETGCAK